MKALSHLKTQGVLSGPSNTCVAMINGKLQEAGDTVRMERDGMIYTWRIRGISTGGIEWEQLEAHPKP